MRGQLILLTAFIAAVAVAAIMAAQIALQMGSYSAGARTGYGIYAKAWPEVVDLADSHVLQATAKASSQLSTAATTAGLYAWLSDLPYYTAKWYTNNSLSLLRTALLPIGAQLNFKYRISYTGFNGTLGPYPQAVEYSRWNLDPVRGGFLTIPGATLYRLVVTWQSDDYVNYYVVTYGAHVSEPGAAGEVYNVALADLLRKLGELKEEEIKSSLFAFLVDSQTCKLYQLPWWAEIKHCPLCLLHVRLPSYSEASGFKLEKEKAVEVLLVFIPNLQGDEIPVLKSGPCTGGQQPFVQDVVKVNKAVNNEPKAVFATQVQYNNQYSWGGRPEGYSNSYYWGADDIASWTQKVVSTQIGNTFCWNPPTGGVIDSRVEPKDDPDFRRVVRVYAKYATGTINWAFNVYYPNPPNYIDLRSLSWRGFTVEALVKPLVRDTIRPARLDLYYAPNSDPRYRHPICASLLAVQAVAPAIVWTNWYAGSGVWNGRTWDDAGSLPFDTSWYLFSISVDTSRVVYSVYSYNKTKPLIRLATKTTTHSWGGDWRFYIVLGSAIVDNPASSTPEEAYYAYVRIRPWVDPPPSVSLAPLGETPLARPGRVDVVALSAAKVEANINASGSVGLANVELLNISRAIGLSVKVVEWSVDGSNPNQDRYHYRVRVESTIPRGAVAAQFTLFYSLGSTYVNATCVGGPCTVKLAEYLGYSGGRDVAEWEVDFTVPKRASHAIFVNVFGSKVAVSTTQPKLYALSLQGGKTWYLINEGDGTGVLYIPWKPGQQGCTRWLADYSPKDPRFIGVYDVKYKCPNCGPCESWTVVLIPPGSVVRLDFTDSLTINDLNTFRAQWQPSIQQVSQPPSCPNPRYLRVYIPGNVSKPANEPLPYYIIYVPPGDIVLPTLSQSLYISFRVLKLDPANPQQWITLKNYYKYQEGLWIRVDGSLTRRGVILAVCSSDSSVGNPGDVFGVNNYIQLKLCQDSQCKDDLGWWWYRNDMNIGLSIDNYPDGFTIIYFTGGIYNDAIVALRIDGYPQNYCSDDYIALSPYNSKPIRLGDLSIWDRRLLSSDQSWRWHYDTFCFDRHIWESQPSNPGKIMVFIISVSKGMVLYQIFDENGYQWVRSYPNTEGYTSFKYAYANRPYYIAVAPFTWPRPYFYVDYPNGDSKGPRETT